MAKAATAQARVALAGQGVQTPGGGSQPGYELLDESKLGASQFQQQVTYQRALEGEVAKTLAGVEGVTSPSVQIVMPQDDLFADEASPATAAVMLGNSSDTLEPGAVRGMAQLAASSVKGLKTENVTITDSSGAVLWPIGRRRRRRRAARARRPPRRATPAASRARSTRCWPPTLGPGKAQVKVNADLNMDKTTEKELTYGAKGTPLTTTEDTETLSGAGAARRAAPRAPAPTSRPTRTAAAPAATATRNYKSKKGTTTTASTRRSPTRKIAAGAVNKLNVALLVDKSVPAGRRSRRSSRPSARPPAWTRRAATR